MDVVISKSENKNQKYSGYRWVYGKKTLHFGHSSYEDFTTHSDPKRRDNYISRHKKNENWGASGVDTAGFYSRWVTWHKETSQQQVLTISITDLRISILK